MGVYEQGRLSNFTAENKSIHLKHGEMFVSNATLYKRQTLITISID